jgi:phage host-nuclease inhibitor protein Gam
VIPKTDRTTDHRRRRNFMLAARVAVFAMTTTSRATSIHMQRRLDDARRELRTLQSTANPRDATAEAELARKIALLEYEVKTPAF